MITLKKQPGDRILELGGGDRPHPECDVNIDVRPGPRVSFVHDFNEPFGVKLRSDEWEGVFAHFLLEHVSYRNVPQFLKEIVRVLKQGGKVVCAVPNTRAQIEWLNAHPDGWDGRDFFASASGVLFGDQDYPENCHRSYFDPQTVTALFTAAGFEKVIVHPYGERNTDMVVEGLKPVTQVKDEDTGIRVVTTTPLPYSREELFDKHYFNGGQKVGGYAREGYRDFPCHEMTFRHILSRHPQSVLELGCARGYVLKRLQDAGIPSSGLEISKHCYLTRVADHITLWDLCQTPWPFKDGEFDLCFSIATLEHVPEEFLPAVLQEMSRVAKRGLHGVDFGEKDDGFDKTHCTLRSKEWWLGHNWNMGPDGIEIVDKESLERLPVLPPGQFVSPLWDFGLYHNGDKKLKLNVGAFTTMYPYGWVNIDIHDLAAFAQQHRFQYLHLDVRNGFPYKTGEVDLIMLCHFLEHLTYDEGVRFLRECRRVLKSDTGLIRIIVPDAALLTGQYVEPGSDGGRHECDRRGDLSQFDEINDGCAQASTAAGKLWALLHEGHLSAYDAETLCAVLRGAGFEPRVAAFRETGFPERGSQMLHETLDMLPCLSLYVDVVAATAGEGTP